MICIIDEINETSIPFKSYEAAEERIKSQTKAIFPKAGKFAFQWSVEGMPNGCVQMLAVYYQVSSEEYLQVPKLYLQYFVK